MADAVGILTGGEVPERLNGPVLKTGGRESRGFESHPLRHVVILVVALLLAGCYARNPDLREPRYFQLALPGLAGAPAVPMQVADPMGMITGADIDPRNPPVRVADVQGLVAQVPGRPDALLVGWPGGCEERADLALEPSELGPNFTLKLLLRPGGCDGAIVARRVIVAFAAPVTAADFNLDVVQ